MDLGLSFYTMAENKQSFVLYADQYELFKKLPNEVAGELIKHIFAYVNDENPQSDNLIINIAFEPIKAQLKRDLKRWEQKIEARSRAGKASAESKKLNKLQQESTNSTYVDSVQQTSTKSTDNVNVNGNVNVNVNEDNKESIGETSSPTLAPSSKKKIKEVDMSKYTPEQIESFRKFNVWIDNEAYNIRKIKEQISIEHYFNLFKKYGKDSILETILALHNKPEYCNGKKAFSVNLTIQNWIKRAQANPHNNKNQTNNEQYIPRISRTEYIKKYGTTNEDDPNA